MSEVIKVMSLQEATTLYESLSVARRIATLHPQYAQIDSLRDSALQPCYLSFSSQGEVWMTSIHLSHVPDTKWWDASSPYGYGGPIATTNNKEFLDKAWHAYVDWMRDRGVVAEYIRFHPLLSNERFYGGKVSRNRSVVNVNLNVDNISNEYASRLQQVIKKAERMNLCYSEISLSTLELARAFAKYYRSAMEAMGAQKFYMFKDEYFEGFATSGLASIGICTHPDEKEQWLSACILLDFPGIREYHLAATVLEGRPYGASSFAVHGAALTAQAKGAASFYLGGGSDRSNENSLLFFKKAFSESLLEYFTGWHVFNDIGYDSLKLLHAEAWGMYPDRPIFWRMV